MTVRVTVDDFNDVRTLAPLEHLDAEDGAALFDRVAWFVRRYVVLSREQVVAVALWTVHTHAFGAAEATAYLHVTSPEPESGKTLLLETLELVVDKPWFTGRVTAAVLARKVDKVRPTLLLDESDAAFGGDKEYAETLRGVLNTGYRAGGKTSLSVKRGADWDFADLSTFCPKAIAGLRELPDTVASRSVRIELSRKTEDEPAARFRRRDARAIAEPLRQAVEVWAAANLDALAAARPALPDELSPRAQDVWEPLLAIADAAAGEWPQRARDAAVALSAGGEREESVGLRLLADIRGVFDERHADKVPSAELVTALVGIEEAPWPDLRGKPLTANRLARMLTPYRIGPKVIRVGDETPRGYERAQFEEHWRRYLPRTPALESQQRNIRAAMRDSVDSEAQRQTSLLHPERAGLPLNRADVADVAVSEGGDTRDGAKAEVDGGTARVPVPGEPNFVLRVTGAYRAGHITQREWRARLALHDAVVGAR